MWGEAAVRIDFVGWEGENGSLDFRVRQTFERREEEPDVHGLFLDVRVGRHDEKHRSSRGGDRCEKSFGRRRQP